MLKHQPLQETRGQLISKLPTKVTPYESNMNDQFRNSCRLMKGRSFAPASRAIYLFLMYI